MKTRSLLFTLFLLLGACTFSWAQEEEELPDEDEEAPADMDFSAFSGDMETVDGNVAKPYCSSKIFGITPSRLISVGYDFQPSYTLTTNAESETGTPAPQDFTVGSTHGLRISTLFPVISQNDLTVSLGFNYIESQYTFGNSFEAGDDPLAQSLSRSGALRSMGIGLTVFKPLDEKRFLLFSTRHDLNGDYWLDEFQPLGTIRHSIAGLYGWRRNDRFQSAFGISRTYLAGELNYVPIILLNYTAKNDKWGLEMILPSYAYYRRNLSTQSILRAGFSLQGATYRLQNRNGQFQDESGTVLEDIELRRSELRLQAIFEQSLSGFVWIAFEVGYRYNWTFDVDSGGDFSRYFVGDDPYFSQNDLTNPVYFNVSLNLVSP